MPSTPTLLARAAAHVRRALDPEAHQPLLPALPGGRWWAEQVVPEEELARVDAAVLDDLGHGHDAYGMSRDGIAVGLLITHHLYHHYFRVQSHGADRVPADGPVVVAANHSGMLPLDALMICADLLRHGPPGRVPRAVVDYFVGQIPLVGGVFARAGAIGGARANVHGVLDRGGLVVIFPEGTRGIGKGFRHRYELQRWSEGHVELAIRHHAPVVPLAVVGAEEAWPQLGRIDGVHLFGAPFVPLPGTLLPLPARFHLWYGEPVPVHEAHAPEEASDPEVVRAAAVQVRQAVEALIAQGLAARSGVFL